MLRLFFDCGFQFNILYSAPTQSLFDQNLEEVERSLSTIEVLQRNRNSYENAADQLIENRLRLSSLMADAFSVEEAISTLQEAQDSFPDNELIQQKLNELRDQ